MSKLLIIEDEPILLKMYKDKFESNNYEIITATDGEQGFESAVKNHPEFIILDLRIPKINGLEVLKLLKDHPSTRDIPVAILTVLIKEVLLKDAPDLMSKVVAFWRKDETTPQELFEEVDKILSKNG